MKKKFILIFILGLCLVSFETVNANDEDEHPPFEKIFFEIGYKTVEEAVDECENLFNEDIVLPYKIPPVQFTHYFGRCSKDIGINNDFEIEFLNENTPENHYTLTLRPKKHAIKFKPERINKTIELDYGTAFFVKSPVSNNLIFERGNWQYILGVDKRISEHIPLEVLVDIANSL
ncbi:hypothetical protein D1953_16505 [Peribacillus asahii]|uniref:DUF4367 domain-containing protein n=1 Tax=Peribacillus asahii TaxID=228899 RepID=A0A398B6E1_9BACI|nr:hypothetical protein [Peribacillus asahii]RID83326.1 hypothetical protein D1953_16505 [Peribacillus asahii]